MKNRLQRELSRLASVEYQRRYVVRGMKDEYALPEELVGNAESVARLALERIALSERERKALESFLRTVKSKSEAVESALTCRTTTNLELIENSPDWRTLRAAAIRCLAELGMPVQKVEGL